MSTNLREVALFQKKVLFFSGKLREGSLTTLDQAVETVPEDVKEWVGEGGQLASRRVEAVVDYVAPRLTQLTSSLARVQQRLAETAEDTLDSVPTLEKLVEELQETLDVARYISDI